MHWFQTSLAVPARILVVGDAMIDRYITGEVTRISPEAPVPVLLAANDEDKPGGAANVAANVAAMGGVATLLCIVGNDAGKTKLESLMTDAGVTLHGVVDADHITTQKTRLVCGPQQIARIDREAKPSDTAIAQLLEQFKANAVGAEFVIFSDYAKGALEHLPQFLAVARELKLRSLIDPKLSDPERYRGAFILKPNELEFRALFGAVTESELIPRAQAATKTYDIQHIVLTRGAKGMLMISANGDVVARPTEAQEVFDVSGAGDTVAAALALAVVGGHSIRRALELSNIAAGVAVAHVGTYVVNWKDIERGLALREYKGQKIVSREVLVPLIQMKRRSGSKIVFTNGCFDILHPGHTRALGAAKKEGDVLIVGMNSDASVSRLKGPQRPINNSSNRAELLAALGDVDFVCEFDEDTPFELIKAVQPDVLVKGGDYSIEKIVGADIVLERGGRVVAVEYHDGHSSTGIINRSTLVG